MYVVYFYCIDIVLYNSEHPCFGANTESRCEFFRKPTPFAKPFAKPNTEPRRSTVARGAMVKVFVKVLERCSQRCS